VWLVPTLDQLGNHCKEEGGREGGWEGGREGGGRGEGLKGEGGEREGEQRGDRDPRWRGREGVGGVFLTRNSV